MNEQKIKIRKLNLEDLCEVENYCRCNWATFVEVDQVKNMSDEEFLDIAKKSQEAMLSPESGLINIVAVFGDEVIGSHFLEEGKDDAGNFILDINNLYVKNGWRRKGISRKMKNYAESIARELGAVAIITSVDTHNKKIIELNESLDYKIARYILRKELN